MVFVSVQELSGVVGTKPKYSRPFLSTDLAKSDLWHHQFLYVNRSKSCALSFFLFCLKTERVNEESNYLWLLTLLLVLLVVILVIGFLFYK